MTSWLDCKFAFGGERGNKNYEVAVETASQAGGGPRQMIKFTSQVVIESKVQNKAEVGNIDSDNRFEGKIDVFLANEMDFCLSEELLKVCHVRLSPNN